MEDEIPSWLTSDFLKNALESDEKLQGISIVDFQFERAVPKGNNYVCDIYRLKVNYQLSHKQDISDGSQLFSLILKVPKAGVGGTMDMIKREVEIYQTLLPMLNRVYCEKMFFPKSYKTAEANVLLMEDLNSLGYKIADRRKQFNLEESVVVLKDLGKFHAVTVKCHEEDRCLIEKLGEDLLFNNETFQKFFNAHYEVAAEHVLRFPNVAKYHDKIKEISKSFHTKMAQLKPENFNFNVLNHGDFWITNLMIKYENDTPIDIKLIDLQTTRYHSPALDLAFFFYASVQDDVRLAHFEDLLVVYHTELDMTLQKLDTKQRLSFEDLKKSLDAFDFLSFNLHFLLLPYVLADPDKVFEISDVSEGSNDLTLIRNLFTSEKYIQLFHKRLEEFEQRGLL